MRRIWLIGILTLVALSLPGFVSAHSELVSGAPRDGAVLDAAPSSIRAVFTDVFDLSGSGLTVEDASGQRVDQDDMKLDANDASQKTMLVTLKSGLGAGTYTVRWKTLAADGDTTEGSWSFSVRSSGAVASPTAGTATPSPSATAGAAAGTTPSPSAAPSTLPATGAAALSLSWLAWLALGLCGAGLFVRRYIVRS